MKSSNRHYLYSVFLSVLVKNSNRRTKVYTLGTDVKLTNGFISSHVVEDRQGLVHKMVEDKRYKRGRQKQKHSLFK